MKITLKDGTVITEKKESVNGFPCIGYYIGKQYAFGAEEQFSKADLQRLYDNGYFDFLMGDNK